MKKIILSTIATLTFVFAGGCAHAPEPYIPPVNIPLQDPPPGKTIVYLIRAPYDSATIAIFLAGTKLAELGPGTYTAITLTPGTHLLTTRSVSMLGEGSEVAPPSEFNARSDQIRFLNISGATSHQPSFAGVVPIRGVGMIPLLISQQGTTAGTRTWKEVTELDAQGLMSISKVTLPERGAL